MNSPIKSRYWKILQEKHQKLKCSTIGDFFIDPNRFCDFSIKIDDTILFDFSKNIIDREIFDTLISLTEDINLRKEIDNMFSGKKINTTENRAVLHTALRDFSDTPIVLDGKDVKKCISSELERIKKFDEKISKSNIKYIVNVGTGGSDLGIRLLCDSLKDFAKKNLKVFFVSNADLKEVGDILNELELNKTLFIINSKTFSTQETLLNANFIKEYFIRETGKKDISENFVAVSMSTSKNKILDFGISEKNIFKIWDWVGGRYSIWSSVGLLACVYIGFDNFKKLLKGAHEIDTHFKNKDFRENIPVVMALISIWYNNFFGTETEAVIPYSHRMKYLLPYLQQCIMESNGKCIDKNGKKVNYQTGNIIWGGVGTNVQHSFFQLLHQGTKMIPCDFITFVDDFEKNKVLFSNYIAQTNALAFGFSEKDVIKDMKRRKYSENEINKFGKYRLLYGNKPSNSLVINRLNPRTLGMLISLYEHKTFVEGIIWNIFSFDQWGVELGKVLSCKILNKFDGKDDEKMDSSTEGLMEFINPN